MFEERTYEIKVTNSWLDERISQQEETVSHRRKSHPMVVAITVAILYPILRILDIRLGYPLDPFLRQAVEFVMNILK